MTATESLRIDRIEGRVLPLRGHDIDTDRILPARFLRAVTFDGIEAHLFEDDRKGNPDHAFSDPRYQGAAILLVNGNFGCGSSREHAPQAIVRHGIRAIVGESFSEIFFGNAVALGLPCVTVSATDIDALMREVEAAPSSVLRINLSNLTVTSPHSTVQAALPHAAQAAFLSGVWDASALLLEHADRIRAVSVSLPYISGF